MAQAFTLVGASILLFINNQQYKVAQSVSFTVDYGESEIRGIDSPFAQEIAGGSVVVKGSVKGLRLKFSGGLQAGNLRPLFSDMAASPYISIRINDRVSGEDILLLTNAKVSSEQHTIVTKGVYRLNFDFVGQIPLFALDRS